VPNNTELPRRAVLPRSAKLASSPYQTIRELLAAWHDALSDCPLPELYRRLRAESPRLTIGQFHDRLRRMHQDEQIYLHPWTGPLYAIPEPAFALLVGHEIAYYASLRV